MRPCNHEPLKEGCKVCYLYATDPRYKALYDGDPVPPPASSPPAPARPTTSSRKECKWLGGPTGEKVTCPTCRGHVELKVMMCEMYGRCLPARHVSDLKCCLNCPSYQPKEQ